MTLLIGIDFQADLVSARKVDDRQSVFGPTGALATRYRQLLTIRRSVDRGTANGTTVQEFFNSLGSYLDTAWRNTFKQLSVANQSSATRATRDRLTALGTTFDVFTSGIGEENLVHGGSLETVLTSDATPLEVQDLIVSHQKFQDSVLGFPAGLGSKAAAAWKTLARNPLQPAVRRLRAAGHRRRPGP